MNYRGLPLLFAALVLACGIGIQSLREQLNDPLPLPEEGSLVVISPGDSLGEVIDQLHQRELIDNPTLLKLWARYTGADVRIQQGEYRLTPPLSGAELMTKLTSGKVVRYRITFPEGITLAEAIGLMAQAPGIDMQLSGPEDIWLQELTDVAGNPEGWFFPDTYLYQRGSSDRQLLARAHQRTVTILAQEWSARASGLPIETPYQALVLASLIEKETAVAAERPDIAGVFTRRLVRRMRLQTDPTVIYGLGENFDGNLTRAHLRDGDNPYNTYHHFGLPPTPIALAGRAAIHAALHPAEGNSLYFVARGDGSHQFSATLEQHREAVRRYQLNRREDYRSTPKRQ